MRERPFFMKLPSLASVVVLLLSLPLASPSLAKAPAYGPGRPQACDYVFSTKTGSHDLGLPREDYDFLSEVDESKSYGMEDTEVFDQGSYGCCWITQEAGKICHACAGIGKKIRPVDTYLASMSIIERALKAPVSRELIGQGGNVPYAISLVNRYGIIPEGALVETAEGLKPWRPIVDFQKGQNGARLIEGVNMKLTEYYDRTNDIVEELEKKISRSFFSSRKSVTAKYFKENPAKKKILEDALISYENAVLKFLLETIGDIPKNFVYEGKVYTPLEFLRENVPSQTLDMTLVLPKRAGREIPTIGQPYMVSPKGWENPNDIEEQAWTSLAGFEKDQSWSNIDDAIEKSLRQNPPVPVSFGIQIKDSLIDTERGYISIDAFAQYPGFREEVQRMAAAIPSFSDGGHAILITKIYRNKAGQTIGYRIQNSWGTMTKSGKKVGDRGYFIMDAAYMQTFSPIFFFQKGIYDAKPLK